jgi:hypothetical protein
MDNRLLHYGCSLIHRQIERGDKKYFLKPVYVLCIADYLRHHTPEVPENRLLASTSTGKAMKKERRKENQKKGSL